MKFFENARQARLVRHEEKLENITRFIGYFLDRLSVQPAPDAIDLSMSLIARSPSSPSALGLLQAINEIRCLGVHVDVVFAKLEPADALADWLARAATPASAGMVALRWARSASLLDAHEQIVLGRQMCWSGDCMRREPESRDAFEMFDTFDHESARRAASSFRLVWARSEAVPAHILRFAGRMVGSLEPLPAELGTGGPAVVPPVNPAASTRH